MIPIEVKQQILDSARIDEVVGDFVILKRRGANLLGLCPFHQEKTPSFIVSPAKGIFKCFGCGKGGDSVTFLMEHEQISYPEALKYLARKYNIEIVEEEKTEAQIQKLNDRESLLQVSEYASSYFSKNLWETEQGRAVGLSYFRERGFSDVIIQKFQLGYCLDSWDAFSKEALKESYPKRYLVSSGLSIEKEDRLYDRFRNRVIFPIHSLSGRIIGFGGRVLTVDKTKAKYVNSPESEIYNKSQVLYGIFLAKRDIINKDLAYLVEGYTDVISLHQAGVTNVVASSGTSLTQDQIKLISRFTKNITILYDGDAAGIKASFRGIDMLLSQGLNVRVVLFPDGHDPDSFAKSHTSEQIEKYLQLHAVDFIRFKTGLLLEEVGEDPIKKAELIENILESIALVPEEIYRAVYIQECSRLLEIDESDLIRKLNKNFRAKYKKQHGEYAQNITEKSEQVVQNIQHKEDESNLQEDLLEREILRLLINYGKENTTQIFCDESGKEIAEILSVCAYIVQEISQDELHFKNTCYENLFQHFSMYLQKGNIPTLETLIAGEKEEWKTLVVDLSCAPYEISPKWLDKGIYVSTEKDKDKLDKIVYETVLMFKLQKVQQMMETVNLNLKEGIEEEALVLLSRKKQLDLMRKMLSEKLRRIIG